MNNTTTKAAETAKKAGTTRNTGVRTMVQIAMLAAVATVLMLWEVPMPVFRTALWLARKAGMMRGLTDDAVARMREDLTFDASPALHDFGYAPRSFILDVRAVGS